MSSTTRGLHPLTLDAVNATALAAIAKHGRDRTPLNPDMPHADKLVILVEEIGELARAMTYDNGDRSQVVREALQVAAMAAMIAESAEHNPAPASRTPEG